MTQIVPNFVKTSLAAPLTWDGTTLELAAGAGAFFDFDAGDWCYITINNNSYAEVVKYTSSGPVVGDDIEVERAQDGTSARAFAAGSCVSVGWNTGQVQSLIDQTIAATATPDNTVIVTATPVAAPADGIYYAIIGPSADPDFYTPGLLYHWTGSVWLLVQSNTVLISDTLPPSNSVPIGVTWAIHLASGSLFYWSGATWTQVAGGNGSGVVEIYGEQGLQTPGYQFPAGTWSFAQLAQTPFDFDMSTPDIRYKGYNGADWIITVDTTGVNAYQMVFHNNCNAQFQASINGTVADPTMPISIQLVITTTAGDAFTVGAELYKPADCSNPDSYLSLVTAPMKVPAGSIWDANLVVNSGTPANSDFIITQIRFAATILTFS